MVARFESLVDTQATLKLEEQKRQVEMEATRAKLLNLRKVKQDEMLRLNQQRTQLCAQLEEARELTQQWVRVPRGPTRCASRGGGGVLRQVLRHWTPEVVLVTKNTWVPLLGRYRASPTLGPGPYSVANPRMRPTGIQMD